MAKRVSVMLILCLTFLWAQLSESFSNTIFPPAGWRVINNDGVGTTTWLRNTTTYNTAPACAACFYSEYDLTNDDWLITPRLIVSADDTLRFYYRSASTATETMEVRISFKGATVNNFTKVIWARRFNNTSYQQAKVSLRPYTDSIVYIAFHYLVQYPWQTIGVGVYLDDISGPQIYIAHDVGVTQILSPIGNNFDSIVLPKVKVKNFGSYLETIPVAFKIEGTSYEKLDTTVVLPGNDTIVNFPACTLSSGTYQTVAYTCLVNDDDLSNDTCYSEFTIRTTNVWQALTPFPTIVKATGTGLCYDNGNHLYCLRASDSSFYAYNLTTKSWERKSGIPIKPKSGLGIAYGNNETIYVLTRNKKHFYKYSISGNTWHQAESIPVKLKSSTGFCSCQDYIYCLAGDTNFLRFSITTNQWQRVKGIPVKIKTGCALTSDSFGYLYALRGTKRDFYRYWVRCNSWEILESIPISKVKKGASLTSDGFNIYCLASGNTRKFYKYNPIDKWQELDSTPQIIKGGGAIAFAQGSVYCLRGSKTSDFWRYIPEAAKKERCFTPQAIPINSITISRNSVNQNKSFINSWNGFQGEMLIYDQSGKFVKRLEPTTLSNLPTGVYFIRLRNHNAKDSFRKLLIVR
ncbi:MAG: choice-of-anchor J domain-containing protein [candidate division WOR-3 bacterium]|nr:choice-of-anchor J domain-containing protein [candidate division WOR-3 bacterium]